MFTGSFVYFQIPPLEGKVYEGRGSNLSSVAVPAPDSHADKSRWPSRPHKVGLGSIHWKESMERRMDSKEQVCGSLLPGNSTQSYSHIRGQIPGGGPWPSGLWLCKLQSG